MEKETREMFDLKKLVKGMEVKRLDFDLVDDAIYQIGIELGERFTINRRFISEDLMKEHLKKYLIHLGGSMSDKTVTIKAGERIEKGRWVTIRKNDRGEDAAFEMNVGEMLEIPLLLHSRENSWSLWSKLRHPTWYIREQLRRRHYQKVFNKLRKTQVFLYDPDKVKTSNPPNQFTWSKKTFIGTWQESVDWAASYSEDGVAGWRLPTIHELVRIWDYEKNTSLVEGFLPTYYWSANTDTTYNWSMPPGDNNYLISAWVFTFLRGYMIAYGKKFIHHARCVREKERL